MSVSMLDAIGSTNTALSTATSAISSQINKTSDQFMMILLAQLKNQNPMEPMKDNEMMAQMTQLNSLQELQTMRAKIEQLAASSSAGYAASLIGKNVKALLSDGSTVEGQVTGTTFKSGLYLLTVNGKQVPLASILEITAPPAAAAVPPTSTSGAVPTPESLPANAQGVVPTPEGLPYA